MKFRLVRTSGTIAGPWPWSKRRDWYRIERLHPDGVWRFETGAYGLDKARARFAECLQPRKENELIAEGERPE